MAIFHYYAWKKYVYNFTWKLLITTAHKIFANYKKHIWGSWFFNTFTFWAGNFTAHVFHHDRQRYIFPLKLLELFGSFDFYSIQVYFHNLRKKGLSLLFQLMSIISTYSSVFSIWLYFQKSMQQLESVMLWGVLNVQYINFVGCVKTCLFIV